MRLVLLTLDHPWQRLLASRLAKAHELALVIVDAQFSSVPRWQRLGKLLLNPVSLIRKLSQRRTLATLRQNEVEFGDYFTRQKPPPLEQSAREVARVANINTPVVAERIVQAKPDAIVLSGGKILKAPVINCPSRFGMLNMHPGLSPYYRGVACTFWSMFHEEPEYAGVTVHYVTPGIDSGDIVLSGRPLLTAGDRLVSLECKVIELGHQLVVHALELLEKNKAPRVPQWEKGKLFLYRQYTNEARLELERKLNHGLMERCLNRLRHSHPDIRTINGVDD